VDAFATAMNTDRRFTLAQTCDLMTRIGRTFAAQCVSDQLVQIELERILREFTGR
jgi:hypothetical protein